MEYQEKIMLAIEKALPGVVSIAASKSAELVAEDLRKMGVPPEQFSEKLNDETVDGKVSVSGGSGFIVDPSGIILTNKHVVQDKKATYKAVIAGESYDLQILGVDPLADIAILKILNPPSSLPSISLSKTKQVKLGMAVIAIGNALGEFSNTVSTGIVSGLSRLLSAITDIEGHQQRLRGLIQTDAAINPGNSGGPLINLEGNAIGINAAVVYGAQNIGFAIPIDRAKKDLDEIKKYGHIRAPFLGIRYVLLNKNIGRHFKIPVERGALIVREELPGDHAVLPGCAAYEAGLKEHDIILTANNKEITEKEALEDVLDTCAIGDELKLGVLRHGKNMSFSVKLEDRAKFS